jgi:exosortase A
MSVMNGTLSQTVASPWRGAILRIGVLLIAIFILYWSTFISMVDIWERSETYMHGFLIFPISLWLVWNARNRVNRLFPQTDWRGLVLLAMAGAGWLLADAGGVQVVTQYAFVTILIAAVWSVLGLGVVRALFFPIIFLYFAVPVGEFLIPPLQHFTSSFVVTALKITGVPVFREGNNFTLPNGNWSVVEACSGLRYLIASLTLGCLYAYLSYRSIWRRLLFIVLSGLVPVLANGLRAYMIVMIGYLSDMKYAVGIDHIIYGWLFFGLVMMLLFWIGNYWREDQEITGEKSVDDALNLTPHDGGHGWRGVLIGALLILLVWPVYGMLLDSRQSANLAQLKVEPASGWQVVPPITDWKPHWLRADRSLLQSYSNGDDRVLLALDYYATQRQGAELINSQNYFVSQSVHERWINIDERIILVNIAGSTFKVRQALLESRDVRPKHLLVWQWNVVDGTRMVNDYYAKLIMSLDKVRLDRDDGSSILVAAQYASKQDEAADKLKRFIKDNELGVMQAIAHVEAK